MKQSHRQATTLFELILVLAIIVVVAAISVPSIGAMYGGYKLNGAVDSVRSAWADARAHAIKEGRPYRFSVQPDGRAFRVAPDQDDYWPGQGSSDDPNGEGLVLERSLPAGVHFSVDGESSSAAADDESDSFDLEEKPVHGDNWSTTVVFMPDGSAREDVRIVFSLRGVRPTALQLRGMTGDMAVETESK